MDSDDARPVDGGAIDLGQSLTKWIAALRAELGECPLLDDIEAAVNLRTKEIRRLRAALSMVGDTVSLGLAAPGTLV